MTHETAPGPIDLSGVVLCGGAGRRLGMDKALFPFDGVPLVVRAVRLLATFVTDVMVASGPARRLDEALDGTPYREIDDAVTPGGGPLGGILAGLEAARHERVAVLAVDMPFASAAVFRLLAGLVGDQVAAVPVTDDGSQPLH